MLRAAQIEERFRAEIRRRGEAQADVRQVGPHIVQQEVGVGGKLLVAQGLDWAVPGAQGGMWQVAHPIWEKRSRPCRPSLPSFNGVGGARKRTKSSVKSSCSWLISGSGAGSKPAGRGLPPKSSSVGCAGLVTLISAANANTL